MRTRKRFSIPNLSVMTTLVATAIAMVLFQSAFWARPALAKDNGAAINRTNPVMVQSKIRLQAVSVKLGQAVYNPTYYVRMANGTVVDLPTKSSPEALRLSVADAAVAAEDTRIILEGVLRLLQTKPTSSMAVINSDYAVVGAVDVKWLKDSGLKNLDPLAVLFSSDESARESEVLMPESPIEAVEIKSRFKKVVAILKDAIYSSAISAFVNHRSSGKKLDSRVTEAGYQIGIRVDLQVGLGHLSFARNIPIMLGLGFNRDTRSIVFRRGIRTEKMEGGTAFSFGGRVEFRRYRMNADEISTGETKRGYASIHGKTWYPPSIPIVSPVADSAPGYQSEGLGFGFNFSNLILPATLIVDAAFAMMNTVNSFEEKQRVYTLEIPEPAKWMKRFHTHMANSSQVFGGGGAAHRCMDIFRPTLVNAR